MSKDQLKEERSEEEQIRSAAEDQIRLAADRIRWAAAELHNWADVFRASEISSLRLESKTTYNLAIKVAELSGRLESVGLAEFLKRRLPD